MVGNFNHGRAREYHLQNHTGRAENIESGDSSSPSSTEVGPWCIPFRVLENTVVSKSANRLGPSLAPT